MKNISLKNDFVSVTINIKGAEVSSFFRKEGNIEHIWQADPKIWARHAPVLFPIVGQVKGGVYTYKGNEYALGQHGFARDKEFEIIESSNTKAVFKLKYNDESLKVYPFKFEFSIGYELVDKKLTISYKVENVGNEEMYFSVGAHPGFNAPFTETDTFEDYYLEFEKEETLDKLILSSAGLLNGEVAEKYINNSKIIPLNYNTFSKDALIFENFKSNYITLKSNKSDLSFKMGIKDFPLLGIWTMPNTKAPYICIEPWYGVADNDNSNGDYASKKAIQKLEKQEVFNADYFFEVN
ncbi:MAG: aldose 1-epimerase family protein [Ichthyobacteriaceae bacterium]|nr:aldose 1-epimerase family protein [Ichthyobacteriaceae bacterium]